MKADRTTDASDLLTPSLGGHGPADARGGPRPWRLGSQVYVAFFGGVIAVTAIAFLNALRLNADRRRRIAILAAGAAGLAACIVFAALYGDEVDGSGLRLGTRAISLVAFGGMYLAQRSPDRVYHYYTGNVSDDDDYESLWVPGLIAALVGGIALALIVAAAAG